MQLVGWPHIVNYKPSHCGCGWMPLGCGVCRSCHEDRAFLGEAHFEAFVLPESEGPDLLMRLFIKELSILFIYLVLLLSMEI